MKHLRDCQRLKNFVPNPGFQTDFVKSNTLNRLITVGNQGGKTIIGSAESAWMSLGEHPYKKINIKVPNIGVIVSALGFAGVDQVIVPKLKSIVGSRDISNIKTGHGGYPSKIIWRNGSITNLMSAEQDNKAFEASSVDWVWIDEPVRREIFIACKRALLKARGYMWITCTPLDEPWIYEELYLPGVSKKDPDIEVFEGTPDQNVHLSEESKSEFRKRLTVDEMEARWFGRFKHLSGRVFKEYRPEKHRIKSFDIPRHWPVYCAIDPHRNKPHAVVFLACAPDGKMFVCNEIFLKCPLVTLADHILNISAQYYMPSLPLIDTSAQESGWQKESCRGLLQEAGVRTRLAQKNNLKASGITLINEKFHLDELFVMEHCHRMHRELRNQVFRRNKRDPSMKIEEPEKKFDDETDALRYILVERPRFRGLALISETGPLHGRPTV